MLLQHFGQERGEHRHDTGLADQARQEEWMNIGTVCPDLTFMLIPNHFMKWSFSQTTQAFPPVFV